MAKDEDSSVFISYATPDRERVTAVARMLMARGINVWMDHLRLRPGQHWDFEIKRALDRASIVLVFASHSSVSRRGYVQREIRTTVDKAKEKLLGDIYLIPVLLDDELEYPEALREWQAVRLSDPDFESALVGAIEHQFAELSGVSEAAQARAGFQWRGFKGQESWDGLPGYDVEWSAYELSSPEHPELEDVNAMVAGRIAKLKMWARRTKLDQSPRHHSWGQPRDLRTTTLDIQFAEPVIKERILSLLCANHVYSAGAAHGNLSLETMVFLLTPLIEIARLEDVFKRPNEALEYIQAETRRLLLAPAPSEDGEERQPDEEWVNSGTATWEAFEVFRFLEAGLELSFPPYQVACYADGTQSVVLSWKGLAPLMNEDHAAAAGVGYLASGDPPWVVEDTDA